MSRARNVKPGFFKNERLAECTPLARILFIGLWCEADREGRLEDRPKRLKAECLPYDDCTIEDLLVELADGGFIYRYKSMNGNAYISLPTFAKHQNPHMREAPSTIPAPDQAVPSTVLAPDEHRSSPADSPLLFPDSPSPIVPPSSSDDDLTGFAFLLADASEFQITKKQLAEFENAYPGVSMKSQFGKIRTWCMSNPRERKTRRGALAFVNRWLDRAQNDASRNGVTGGGQSSGGAPSDRPLQRKPKK